MEYTVSRTAGGKWLLYSKGKFVKPYDYVPSDFSVLVQEIVKNESRNDKDERGSQPLQSSGPDTSQYTFAHVGVQATAASIDSRKAGEGVGHHGWQPALMTGFMWMANVTGEFLYRMNEEIRISPMRALSQLVDDPVGTMEQAIVDLKIANGAKDLSSMLKQLSLLIYYSKLQDGQFCAFRRSFLCLNH